MQITKVQAIETVDGVDPHTFAPVKLAPWTVGWMEAEAAAEADQSGAAQILAGRTPQSLITPESLAASPAKPKRRGYKRRDLQAELAVSDDADSNGD